MTERDDMELRIRRKVRPFDPDRRQDRAAALSLILTPYVSEKDLNGSEAPPVVVALSRHIDALIDEYVDSAITESVKTEPDATVRYRVASRERDKALAKIERVRALVEEAIADADQERMGTHWDGCHRVHHDCLGVAIRTVLD